MPKQTQRPKVGKKKAGIQRQKILKKIHHVEKELSKIDKQVKMDFDTLKILGRTPRRIELDSESPKISQLVEIASDLPLPVLSNFRKKTKSKSKLSQKEQDLKYLQLLKLKKKLKERK